MKFIAATDLHLADKPPVSRIDADFPEELFELLAQLGQAARAVQAKAILFPGDLTHMRSRLGSATLARFIEWCFDLKDDGIDILGIPGNHDLLLNRYETLPQTWLGLLFQIGAVKNVSVTQDEEPAIYWKDGEYVSVGGVPFPDAFDLGEWDIKDRMPVRPDLASARIVLGHCFAAPSPGRFYGDPVHSYSELLAWSGADYVVLGHDHADKGVHRFDDLKGARWVLDQPAMMRGAASTGDIQRDLKFAIIDTAARDVQQVRYNYRPASAIFDLERRDALQAEREQVESFITRLEQDLQAQAAGTTLEAKLDGLNLPSQVRDRVMAYIEQAEQAQQDALAG